MTEREIIAKEWRDENGILHRREVGQELVRCKECKWYKDFDGCFFSTAEVEEDDFCSYGEREGE